MTAVDLPDEPPVGTTLTAPGARHLWTRDDTGWWVTDLDGVRLAAGAPADQWEFGTILTTLRHLGGPVTVTTEYQVTYRSHGMDADETDIVNGGFKTRSQIAEWRTKMDDAIGIRITGVRSQRVTRSEWRDEPLEDPT